MFREHHRYPFNIFQPGLKQETLLLLAKLQYTMGDYNGALARYDEVKLDTITVESISNRRLKLVGEAFAIKGRVRNLIFVC